MRICYHTYTGFLLGLLFITASATQAQELKWNSFENALAIAQQEDRLIVVDVWAPWCGWCHKMKQETYPQLPQNLAQQFVFTRLNRDDHETEHRYKGERLSSMRLAQKINTQTVPAVVMLSSDGNYLAHISGFINSEKLRAVLLQMQQFTSEQ